MAKLAKTHWRSFTKAELIRTVKTLSARETKLLNRIAKLETLDRQSPTLRELADVCLRDAFPWETKT